MEDILASIKRIIAEDSEAVGARAPRIKREMAKVESIRPVPAPQAAEPEVEESDEGDVLELTSPIEEARAAAPEPVEQAEPEIEEIEEAAAPAEAAVEEPLETVAEAAQPAPEAVAAPEPVAPEPIVAPAAAAEPAAETETKMDMLLSGEAQEASRNAFAALSQLQLRVETGASNTLEGLVADLLRPMLREWLDRELPNLVERLVDAEISRVSRRT